MKAAIFALAILLPISAAAQTTACGSSIESKCPEGEFCQFDRGRCGDTGSLGRCEKIPDACIEVFMPICGCDGKTYSNECDAFRHGVSVQRYGKCEEKK